MVFLKQILFFSLILGTYRVNSQSKTNNNWHFGQNCEITFNSGFPTNKDSSSIFTTEGCSSISDISGNVLFYTDGVKVWNKLNQQMPNGFNLGGHYSSTQSALIVKQPLSNNIYFVFTTNAVVGAAFGSGGDKFRYSVVDLNQQSGLGDVIVKNKIICDSSTEKVAAVINESDTSVWLISHEWGSNRFFSYKLAKTGLDTIPVISSIGSPHCCDINFANSQGQLKVSPDGKKAACCIYKDSKIELFDFDITSGILSNPITITEDLFAYGAEFSPNSSLLYITTTDGCTNLCRSRLVQYDISNWNSATIINSRKELYYQYNFSNYLFGQLQLAPDGKIYLAGWDDNYLSIINNPDALAFGCNFAYRSFLVQNNQSSRVKGGLPNCVAGFYKTQYVPPDPSLLPQLAETLEPIPNVFTPNSDGINDTWNFMLPKNSELIYLDVYNRWGIKVFSLSDQSINSTKANIIWDGFTTSGIQCASGVYFYVFNYRDKTEGLQKTNGFITLIKD